MAVVLQKSTLFQILFAICIAVPYLNIYELTFAVWTISTLISLQFVYSRTILNQLFSFISIIGVAFIVLFFKKYQMYYIIRDITYMVKPIFGLLIGYNICRKHLDNPFKTIINTGLFIASIHLLILLQAVIFHHARTVNDLRFFGGYFSDFEIYALIILIFHKKFEVVLTYNRFLLYLLVIGLSAFLYLARTNFLQFIILFVAMKGYFRITKTSLKVLTSIVLFSIIGYSTILYINPKRNGKGIEALLYKIKIAPTEPFKTKINEDDWKDFNDNYRSYENILTVKQMSKAGPKAVIFGEGIGSKIDLKREVYLGDMMLRYISILHNGFMTVFLKSGLLGIFIYLYSIILLFKTKASTIPIHQNIKLLLIGTGVFLFLSNWVFMGVYNLLDNKSILIGVFICYYEIVQKRQMNKNL